MEITEAHRLWDAAPGWLNTASYGLPPRVAWIALQEALDDWRHGRTSWEGWDTSTARSRAAFAELLGVPTADVAVGSTTSGLLAPVAAALPDIARVVLPDIEFTSNVFPWMVHADRGVEVVAVPPGQLVDAVDRRTTVVTFSAVQSATGEVADFDALVEAARAVGAMVVVDASQAAGWLPLAWSRADVVVASAYKWLMAPRGAAFGYLSPAVRERFRPLQAGWYAGTDPHASYYGPPLRLAEDARKFDISPAWFCFVGAAPALELLVELGVERVNAHNVALANRFRAGLGLPPGDSAIVSTDVPDAESKLAAAGIRAAVRGGRVRVSFHVYSTEADVDAALDALA
ncbi:aminotransferase class V-fold PLP-dependent enzyme [Actinopolymorpha alba]|uniref:aminotransferase class V-fold PLP-dependent enzyme n=1 Tax=Actinopolymorpha alba TaxID=533267 RepID=UPI00035F3443|nr:aminotransferase class V-fold PLP-dependent enzyme [Actinopolymorpha alba]